MQPNGLNPNPLTSQTDKIHSFLSLTLGCRDIEIKISYVFGKN